MGDINDPITNFMNKKNKESLGESVETDIENNDNFEVTNTKTRNTFNDGESISKDDTKALVILRRFMNMALIIPIVIVSLMAIFYVVLQLMPTFLVMVKNFFFLLF